MAEKQEEYTPLATCVGHAVWYSRKRLRNSKRWNFRQNLQNKYFGKLKCKQLSLFFSRRFLFLWKTFYRRLTEPAKNFFHEVYVHILSFKSVDFIHFISKHVLEFFESFHNSMKFIFISRFITILVLSSENNQKVKKFSNEHFSIPLKIKTLWGWFELEGETGVVYIKISNESQLSWSKLDTQCSSCRSVCG